MIYKAAEISDYTFEQLQLHNDCIYEMYNYPLIFLKLDTAIIFYAMFIKLRQIEYDFLYELVKNVSDKNCSLGLTPIELFEKLQCRHTRKKTKDNEEKYNNDTKYRHQLNDERVRDIKRDIIRAIKCKYSEMSTEVADNAKRNKESKFNKLQQEYKNNDNNLVNDLLEQEYRNELALPYFINNRREAIFNKHRYFFGEIEIDSNSPYYYFNIETAIKTLIAKQGRGLHKKYTTEFRLQGRK